MIANTRRRSRAAARLFLPGVHMPVYALVFVTTRCAAKCEHCFYWQDLNTPEDELTVAEYGEIARGMGPMLQVTLTGGSPEQRKDLPAIALQFHEHCRPVNMTWCMLGYSTGRVLAQIEEVLESCPDMNLTIGLSLDGVGEEHDRLRVMDGLFDRMVQTARGIGELKEKYGKLALTVATTVSGLNHETALATTEWAWENLPVDMVKPILVRGNPKNPQALDPVCHTAYLQVVDVARERMRERLRLRPSLFRRFVLAKETVQRDVICSISQTGRQPALCSGGRETTVIYPNGDVAGCELRDEILGNLRDHDLDLRKVWLGPAGDRFRDGVGKAAACKGCYHHCFLAPAIVRSPRLFPRLAKAAVNLGRTPSSMETFADAVPRQPAARESDRQDV